MQPRIDVTVPSEQTDALLAAIRGVEGVLGLRVQRGISEKPRGDVVSVDMRIEGHLALIALLQERGIGTSNTSSISVSQPDALISPSVHDALGHEANLSSWEQIQTVIARTSNMSIYALTSMFVSGVIAAIGISTGALHVAVGAFMIAPAFQPIVRIPLGLVARTHGWRYGLRDLVLGSLVLIAGAFLAALLMRATGGPLLQDGAAYESVSQLVAFWTTITLAGGVVGVTGGFIGAVLIACDRAILTAGVVVALALVPTATMVGVGLAAGDFSLALDALVRFLAEVLFVIVGSTPVWAWVRARGQARPSMV